MNTLVQKESGKIGAADERIEVAIRNVMSKRDDLIEAGSRITDTDMAEEAALLTRNSILQRIGARILAQSKLHPSLVTRLLGMN